MKNMKLITEISHKYDIVDDGKDLFIEGVFSTADVMNNNGRRYPRKVLEREINRVMELVESKRLFGELSHPESPSINLDRVAILTTSLKWEDSSVVGRAKVLDTPTGNIAKVLIKEGNLGISSRGLGTVNEENNFVNEDFNLICYDLVGEPSNPGSWVRGIYEGKTFPIPSTEPEEPIVIVPKITLDEARKEYKRHIWQVLEKLGKEV